MALGPVGQIHISVTEIDTSVAFYRDVLGIPLLFQVPGMPMAFFASGDVRLYLGAPESPEFRSKVVLYFTVSDIDAEYERLRDQHGCRSPARPTWCTAMPVASLDDVHSRPGRPLDRPHAAAWSAFHDDVTSSGRTGRMYMVPSSLGARRAAA